MAPKRLTGHNQTARRRRHDSAVVELVNFNSQHVIISERYDALAG